MRPTSPKGSGVVGIRYTPIECGPREYPSNESATVRRESQYEEQLMVRRMRINNGKDQERKGHREDTEIMK
jgi:hypothetical protein